MSQYILELKNIGKTFSGVNVLRDVNLQLKKGEVHVLLGENGAGKSTLIKIISGYHQPDKGGEIYVEGERKEFSGPKQPKDAGIHTIYHIMFIAEVQETHFNDAYRHVNAVEGYGKLEVR